MACLCGHERHERRCRIYTAGEGYCSCESYEAAGSDVPWLKVPGRAAYRKMYEETQAFRDKAVATAAAKKRVVGKW